MNNIKIAAFGFRSIPPKHGSAGADKFAFELYTRMASRGYPVVIYNRLYGNDQAIKYSHSNMRFIEIKTVGAKGFDSLIHSALSTFHIILFNTANVVHIHNGGNSIFIVLLKLFRKKTIVIQDGLDWERSKWSIFPKIFLFISSFITAYLPNKLIFDNIFAQKYFEDKFKKKYYFIPFGADVEEPKKNEELLATLGITPNKYILFIGRFIPDKGVHYLVEAFEKVNTEMQLVIIGGSPNPSGYESKIKSTKDKRIHFPGYIYGDDVNYLIKNAYIYIQPSEVEGLSPLILTVMYLGTPLLCSDIKENIFAVNDTALLFKSKSVDSLKTQIEYALKEPAVIQKLSKEAKLRSKKLFSWDGNCTEHLNIINSLFN